MEDSFTLTLTPERKVPRKKQRARKPRSGRGTPSSQLSRSQHAASASSAPVSHATSQSESQPSSNARSQRQSSRRRLRSSSKSSKQGGTDSDSTAEHNDAAIAPSECNTAAATTTATATSTENNGATDMDHEHNVIVTSHVHVPTTPISRETRPPTATTPYFRRNEMCVEREAPSTPPMPPGTTTPFLRSQRSFFPQQGVTPGKAGVGGGTAQFYRTPSSSYSHRKIRSEGPLAATVVDVDSPSFAAAGAMPNTPTFPSPAPTTPFLRSAFRTHHKAFINNDSDATTPLYGDRPSHRTPASGARQRRSRTSLLSGLDLFTSTSISTCPLPPTPDFPSPPTSSFFLKRSKSDEYLSSPMSSTATYSTSSHSRHTPTHNNTDAYDDISTPTFSPMAPTTPFTKSSRSYLCFGHEKSTVKKRSGSSRGVAPTIDDDNESDDCEPVVASPRTELPLTPTMPSPPHSLPFLKLGEGPAHASLSAAAAAAAPRGGAQPSVSAPSLLTRNHAPARAASSSSSSSSSTTSSSRTSATGTSASAATPTSKTPTRRRMGTRSTPLTSPKAAYTSNLTSKSTTPVDNGRMSKLHFDDCDEYDHGIVNEDINTDADVVALDDVADGAHLGSHRRRSNRGSDEDDDDNDGPLSRLEGHTLCVSPMTDNITHTIIKGRRVIAALQTPSTPSESMTPYHTGIIPASTLAARSAYMSPSFGPSVPPPSSYPTENSAVLSPCAYTPASAVNNPTHCSDQFSNNVPMTPMTPGGRHPMLSKENVQEQILLACQSFNIQTPKRSSGINDSFTADNDLM